MEEVNHTLANFCMANAPRRRRASAALAASGGQDVDAILEQALREIAREPMQGRLDF